MLEPDLWWHLTKKITWLLCRLLFIGCPDLQGPSYLKELIASNQLSIPLCYQIDGLLLVRTRVRSSPHHNPGVNFYYLKINPLPLDHTICNCSQQVVNLTSYCMLFPVSVNITKYIFIFIFNTLRESKHSHKTISINRTRLPLNKENLKPWVFL